VKKIITLALVFVLALSLLTACGGNGNGGSTGGGNTTPPASNNTPDNTPSGGNDGIAMPDNVDADSEANIRRDMDGIGLGGVTYPDGGVLDYFYGNAYFTDGSFDFQVYGVDEEGFHAFALSVYNALAAQGQVYSSTDIGHVEPISVYTAGLKELSEGKGMRYSFYLTDSYYKNWIALDWYSETTDYYPNSIYFSYDVKK
jgi:hypothetical protein